MFTYIRRPLAAECGRVASEILVHGDALDLITARRRNAGSAIYFLTVTPSPASGNIPPSVLLDQFRGFYIRLLRATIPNFARPSKQHLHPYCVAYVDEPSSQLPFRHVHALLFVQAGRLAAFEKFFALGMGVKDSRTKRAWRRDHPRGTMDLQLVGDADEDVHLVTSYAGKHWRKLQDREGSDPFVFHRADSYWGDYHPRRHRKRARRRAG